MSNTPINAQEIGPIIAIGTSINESIYKTTGDVKNKTNITFEINRLLNKKLGNCCKERICSTDLGTCKKDIDLYRLEIISVLQRKGLSTPVFYSCIKECIDEYVSNMLKYYNSQIANLTKANQVKKITDNKRVGLSLDDLPRQDV